MAIFYTTHYLANKVTDTIFLSWTAIKMNSLVSISLLLWKLLLWNFKSKITKSFNQQISTELKDLSSDKFSTCTLRAFATRLASSNCRRTLLSNGVGLGLALSHDSFKPIDSRPARRAIRSRSQPLYSFIFSCTYKEYKFRKICI